MSILYHIKKRKLSSDVLSEMCRHIGTMTGAGITLAKSMEILKTITENKRTANIYGSLEERIRQGYPIGDSLEELDVFPEMMINMFRAAEVSGQLEKTANYLAEYYRKEHRTTTQMKAATVYPKILCVMAISIVMFIFLVIIPLVEPIFHGVELPLITRMLMDISKFIKEYWYIIMITLVVIAALEPIVVSVHSVRYVCDRMILYIPVVGKQMRTIYSARFARTLSSLYSNGVPMMTSLEISSRTLGNRYMELQLLELVRKIENGEILSQAIKSIKEMDMKLPAVIYVGEETGKMDAMLLSLAEGYEHETEIAMNKMVSMIEPFMIVVIGIVVAVILLGIMIPMWSLYEYLG